MVCGFRYNAKVLARHVAETVFGIGAERPLLEPAEVVPYLLDELNRAPELAMQKGYLARVLAAGDEGVRDEGILPLEVFVDGERDGVAATLEFDAEETIRPVVYVRSAGVLRESVLPPHPLRRYDDRSYVESVGSLLRPFFESARS